MPNYLYKCNVCDAEEKMTLPISSNPESVYTCLRPMCDGEMSRKFIVFGSFRMGRNTLGAWYKNKTGKELLGGE